ncbi:MAG: helix-turn-helix transcriptional regulator [Romboutsia timonensis]|uniref:helix-turn-helix domain-containing protein n=1 Tax=Romboutsia timonensis TaxID=1776391 RepID=UPI002A75F2AA|nr:helix-turn-helix transcriptional regulator [Romboutsia timonensis]MDY3000294.1 helix-turn-helix transcriptional regulator [Romboutsia timonensis]
MNKTLEKETIGSRIKKTRIKQNITIRELCKLTEIEEVLLSTYESELMEPNVREIAKISIALNVTSDYILGRIDEETNYLRILNRYKGCSVK